MKPNKVKFDKDGYQIDMSDLNGEAVPLKMRTLDVAAQKELGIPSAESVLEELRTSPKRGTSVRLSSVRVLPVRAKLKLSQKDFAVLVGTTPAAVRNWEQGRSPVPPMAKKLFRVIEKRPAVIKDLAEA